MAQLTVKELLAACQKQVDSGNGDKLVVVGDDNEGNGYHGLCYDFTEDVEPFVEDIYDSVSTDPKKIIILG